jgi:hypothetical protein
LILTDDELEDLFSDLDSPDHELQNQEYLLEPRPHDKPSRIRQLVPLVATAEADQTDEPNEFETPEWEQDFESKASALRDVFQQTVIEELHIELFGSLESKCHVLADERKATARSFYELESLIQEHNDVFLYNQEFKNRSVDPETGDVKWYPKDYDALTGFRCFVEDIDEVDASNIHSVIDMIMSKPIRPNYINLTGNGLHLYFIFDALHDMKHSAWLMAYVNGTSIESERDVYVAIKQGMIAWFHSSTAESDVKNHLAQPSRLPGSKTKNRNKRTILFKVSDTKYSIQHIASLVGIELPDEESIREWKKKVAADQRRWRKQMPKDTASKPASLHDLFDYDAPEPMLEVTTIEDEVNVASHDVDNPESKYRFNFDGIRQRMIDEDIFEQESPETQYYAELKRLRAEKNASAGYQKRKIAQRRGLESQYQQFKQYCHDVARHGKRADLLHIFWNRAPLYQQDQNVIQRDFDDLFVYCNALHRTKKVTMKQYNSIVNGPRIPYRNGSISRHLDVDLKFKNKSKDEMLRKRDEKNEKWKRILLICESELQADPKLSDRQLTKILNTYGIKVCHKTISTRFEVKELRARLRMQ